MKSSYAARQRYTTISSGSIMLRYNPSGWGGGGGGGGGGEGGGFPCSMPSNLTPTCVAVLMH